jgi:hypothetical protein
MLNTEDKQEVSFNLFINNPIKPKVNFEVMRKMREESIDNKIRVTHFFKYFL